MVTTAERDQEGFLLDLNQWDRDTAEAIAKEEGIKLESEHWEILQLTRDYYLEFDASPAMRALVKYIKLRAGPEKSNSIYLLKLFPGSPAKLSAKIAGLPKPANCL